MGMAITPENLRWRCLAKEIHSFINGGNWKILDCVSMSVKIDKEVLRVESN